MGGGFYLLTYLSTQRRRTAKLFPVSKTEPAVSINTENKPSWTEHNVRKQIAAAIARELMHRVSKESVEVALEARQKLNEAQKEFGKVIRDIVQQVL